MSAAVCQESKTLEVAEEEEKRIEGAENKGEREGREAASKKVGLVTPASVASIVANVAFHARDRTRINSNEIFHADDVFIQGGYYTKGW